jgi:hypothetical protein
MHDRGPWWPRRLRELGAEHLGGPVDQAASEAYVRPDLPYLRMVESSPQKRPLRALTILDAGRDDMDRDEQAEGVGDQEPLAALTFLPASKPLVAAGTVSAVRTDCESIRPIRTTSCWMARLRSVTASATAGPISLTSTVGMG